MGESMTKLDLSAFAHSHQWVQCHRPTRTEPYVLCQESTGQRK
jgi:hypothetical protein